MNKQVLRILEITIEENRFITKRDRFSVALYATEERSPEDEKLYANYVPHFNFGPIERGEKQTNNIN